jgi:alpha-mannosidase
MNSVLSMAAGCAVAVSGFAVAAAHAQDAAKASGGAKVPVPSAAAGPTAPTPDLTKQPTLYVVGYAHLDTQWRWTYIDTIKEFIPNTLNRNFALFDKYPGYIFNFSGSRRYEMMKEYYPADYEKLKTYVAQGKWFPCGSSVDENDANVPSAESLVRHVLYGNSFFRKEFGKASDEYMLPDCFGFPAALPSVLAHCGIKGFSTQKLTWNAVVPIPFKVGVWNGPDGHGVMAALDPGNYVGEVKEDLTKSESWKTRIDNNGKGSGVFVDYHYYGTGDQGGSPTEGSVAKVQESSSSSGPIKVVSSQADWMFNAIKPELRQKLPTYQGELELTEHSAGSVTSEAYMKRWNRKNELLADSAERAAVSAWWMGGRDYPAQKLENAWYLLLGSQMHDILPGTSVPHAYDLSWNDEVLAGNQFGQVLEDGAGVVIAGMDTRAKGTSIVVFNPLSIEREDVVEAQLPSSGRAQGVKVTGADGKPVPAQILSMTDTGVRVAILAKAPSVGFAAYDVELTADAKQVQSTLRVKDRELENEMYVVKLDDHGDVSSIFDKQAKHELLAAPARLGLHYENPRNWPAWNQDWEDRQKPAKAFAGAEGPVSFKVVENGPARVAVEVTRQAEGSTFTQRIRLAAGGAAGRVEFETDIDWRTRQRSVRATFPLAVSNPKATYDIQQGTIERGNGHEKQFEYAFHQWFDLTDTKGDYGVSVMCDSKYGADKPGDNTVRLTLLHTPGTRGGFPDQGTQDIGRHHVLYAVSGHSGDWRKGQSPAQASRLNQPLISFAASPHEGTLGKSFSLMHVSDPNVAISAIKKAEDGDEVVVRLRELTGNPAKAVHVAMAAPIASAREIDGQERQLAAATVTGGELVTDVHGYGLKAFALKVGAAPVKAAQVESAPVKLAFDTDAVSTNANRGDGSFDGHGAIPAEQLPQSLAAEGVTFTFGPTADGQKNAVACKGQEIAIPQGGFDRLYLLAAADQDVKSEILLDGKSMPWSVQGWSGMIGQWDRRIWPGDAPGVDGSTGSEIAGLEPGFVKRDPVTWYCSHHHTATGDAFYEYSYIYKYGIDLPAGAKSVKLPNDPHIKVFAASVAKIGPARAVAAAPLFDTLTDHIQDAPHVVAASTGAAKDATDVKIEPGLYWRTGMVHYTLDGSEPGAKSPVYAGPLTLASTATVKAAVVGRDGRVGPLASTKVEVDDHTPPSVKSAVALFQSPRLWVDFSEPLDRSAAESSHFTIEPSLAVKSAELSPDGRRVTLTLAAPAESGKPYKLSVSGIKDTSPAANTLKQATVDFTVAAPVYTLAEVGQEQRGTTIRDTKGLPVKAGDAWTINVFVKTDKPVPNRTIIAGFGKCDGMSDGQARYIAKFANGLQLWVHNRDVESRTALEQNHWQMLTATYDGHSLRMYKDGQKVGEGTVTLADDDNVINITPKDPWEHRRQFEGDIRALTIWDTALGEDAIAALKTSTSLP